MVQHITNLLQDRQREYTLADNATDCRDHLQIASRIAALRLGP